MNFVNLTSAWAARHSRQAIPLIILLEFINATLGMMVGSALLKDFSTLVLMGLILGVVLINLLLKRYVHIRLFDLISQALEIAKLSDTQFLTIPDRIINLGFSPSRIWFKFDI